jgi:Tfp pilus assembly protein PilV
MIEVLIGLSVLSAGLLSVFSLQTHFITSTELALQNLRALHQMDSQLEYFRTRSSSPSAAAGSLDFAILTTGHRAERVDGIELSWEVNLVALAAEPLKQVEITATWQDRKGATHTKKLTTLYSQYGEFD